MKEKRCQFMNLFLILLLSSSIALSSAKTTKPSSLQFLTDKSQSKVSIGKKSILNREFDSEGFITRLSLDLNNDGKADAVYNYNKLNYKLDAYQIDNYLDGSPDETFSCKTLKNKEICEYKLDLDNDKKMDFSLNVDSFKSSVLNNKILDKIRKNENKSIYSVKKDRKTASIPGINEGKSLEAGIPGHLLNGCTDEKCRQDQAKVLFESYEKWSEQAKGDLYYPHITGSKKPSTKEEKRLAEFYKDFKRTKFDFLIHKSCDYENPGKKYNLDVAKAASFAVSEIASAISVEIYADEEEGPSLDHHMPRFIKLMASNHPDNMPKIICGPMLLKSNKGWEKIENSCDLFGGALDSRYKSNIIHSKCNDKTKEGCLALPLPVLFMATPDKKCDKNDTEHNKQIVNEFPHTLIHELFHTMGHQGVAVLKTTDLNIEYSTTCAFIINDNIESKLSVEHNNFIKNLSSRHCRRPIQDTVNRPDEVRCELFYLCIFGRTHDRGNKTIDDCKRIIKNPNTCDPKVYH